MGALGGSIELHTGGVLDLLVGSILISSSVLGPGVTYTSEIIGKSGPDV